MCLVIYNIELVISFLKIKNTTQVTLFIQIGWALVCIFFCVICKIHIDSWYYDKPPNKFRACRSKRLFICQHVYQCHSLNFVCLFTNTVLYLCRIQRRALQWSKAAGPALPRLYKSRTVWPYHNRPTDTVEAVAAAHRCHHRAQHPWGAGCGRRQRRYRLFTFCYLQKCQVTIRFLLV